MFQVIKASGHKQSTFSRTDEWIGPAARSSAPPLGCLFLAWSNQGSGWIAGRCRKAWLAAALPACMHRFLSSFCPSAKGLEVSSRSDIRPPWSQSWSSSPSNCPYPACSFQIFGSLLAGGRPTGVYISLCQESHRPSTVGPWTIAVRSIHLIWDSWRPGGKDGRSCLCNRQVLGRGWSQMVGCTTIRPRNRRFRRYS